MRRLSPLALIVLSLVLTACTGGTPNPTPTTAQSTPEDAAKLLATALSKKDISGVEFVGATGAEVNQLLRPVVAGMGPLQPVVAVGAVNRDGDSASADLTFTWSFPGLSQTWTYPTNARLSRDAGVWKTNWQPSVVQPQLDGTNRLSQRRIDPARGQVLGEDGDPIVKLRAVYRIGIDKSAVKAAQQKSSAIRMAKLLKINAAAYAKLVAAAGESAFVEGLVLRTSSKDLPLGSQVKAIPGGLAIQARQMLAPTRDFARPVLGIVGEATKEIVDASGGAVVAGDQVGLTGLQKRYDGQLRGTPGVEVRLVATKATTNASASPSPTPSAAPATPGKPVTVFTIDPQPGKPLTTTFIIDLQKLAEKTVGKAKPAAALVAIRPSTGAILAAANNPGTNGQSIATVGQAPPGSTFKVVTALALLRAGLTPDSTVKCPTTISVNGRSYKNYSDFPTSRIGSMPLRTALAQSCNTAFVGERDKLSGTDLPDAAASLGLGTDYDVGFSSFFGAVPSDTSGTAEAEAMFGQGKVQASPMAMAAVVASVSAGRTVIPHLIDGQVAKPKAKPLTKSEASRLRSMMRGVVADGTGHILRDLSGGPVIAKTGTAEYGPTDKIKTHAWMIAAQNDLAVAVFVNDGKSGSGTAGPLLRSFLDGAQ
jgi:cell division protein FtsI/penicillin-binding protein 2